MRRHIRRLLRKHRIKSKIVTYARELADLELRTVHIREIRGKWSYLVALHEIAHIVHKPAHPREPLIPRECAAWQWAIGKSEVPLPPNIFRKIADILYEWRGVPPGSDPLAAANPRSTAVTRNLGARRPSSSRHSRS